MSIKKEVAKLVKKLKKSLKKDDEWLKKNRPFAQVTVERVWLEVLLKDIETFDDTGFLDRHKKHLKTIKKLLT